MKKHFGLVAIRLLFAFIIAKTLVFSNIHWGETYPGDGQEAFSFVILFALLGLAVAVAYFVVGCIVQAVLRRKNIMTVLIVDVIMALALISILAVGGINAHYENADPKQPVEEGYRR
jgi:hypothetical protein